MSAWSPKEKNMRPGLASRAASNTPGVFGRKNDTIPIPSFLAASAGGEEKKPG